MNKPTWKKLPLRGSLPPLRQSFKSDNLRPTPRSCLVTGALTSRGRLTASPRQPAEKEAAWVASEKKLEASRQLLIKHYLGEICYFMHTVAF
jgi:hypothetical protein